ncbi:11236_t:CDS:2 [Racocetra fulgida]|uniref:11236_t:CDS:1 n=1 Tax=Racocetra fulgida TaxID=60492 RepID=A0A9N8YSD7_9GLOM|nr:11236_t:CDS:2 [Racocetra fulgida]
MYASKKLNMNSIAINISAEGENFDDYYQVFLKYKEEMDSQSAKSEEQNSSSDGETLTPNLGNNKDKTESEESEKKDWE